MNLNYIKSLTNTKTFYKGLELYQDDCVCEFDMEQDAVYAEVLSSNGYNCYSVRLVIDYKKGRYLAGHCDCPAFATYAGPCKHCIAALIEYLNYVAEDEEEYYEDEKLENLILNYENINRGISNIVSLPTEPKKRETEEGFKKVLYQEQVNLIAPNTHGFEEGSIDIEPLLKHDYHGITLEFKVGEKQKYIIKDLIGFVDRFTYGATYKYGKNLNYTHTKTSLSEQGKIYLDYIAQWVERNREYHKIENYTFANGEFKRVLGYEEVRAIPMSAILLELFLECVQMKSIMTQLQFEEKQVLPIYFNDLHKFFYLEEVAGGVEFSIDSVKMLTGNKYYIFMDNEGITLMDRNKIEQIMGTLECVLNQRERSVYIANEDVPAFCRNLLPHLRAVFYEKSSGFDESKYIYESLALKVYLDMPQENMVSIRPVACYGEEAFPVYDAKKGVEKRDLSGEAAFARIVNQYSNAYDGEHYTMVLFDDDNLLYQLLTEGVVQMQEYAEVYASDAIKALQPKYKPKVVVGVAIEGGLLSFDVQLENLTIDEMIEILSKYDKKKRYHRLKNGAFIHVDGSGLDEFAELKDGLGLSEKELKNGVIQLPTYRTFYMDEQLKNSEHLQYTRNRTFKQLVRTMKTIEENDFNLPASMESILREYQKNGFLWLKTLKENGFGGILADDMGLGKTVQVIAFLESELEQEDVNQVLIVTPASLVYNWKRELERFAPQLNAKMVVGTAKERRGIIGGTTKKEILITSYDLLKRDIESYENQVFDIQVIDEAQFIKNSGTQATKAVKCVQSKFKIALTGTPVENRLSELWSIFDYVMPGFLYGAKKFRDELESPIVKKNDDGKLEQLKKMVTPFILRRRKQDVLKDLPDKVEENRMVLLEKEQKSIYDAHAKRIKMSIGKQSEAEFKTSKIQILAELTKLRQICCDPRLFLDNYTQESAKLEMCIQLIQNAVEGGHKILLFSQFTTMFEYIQKRLEADGISYYTLTGATSKEKRAKMVQAFNTDETSVFCISLKAGGTGLNLTGADIVIHYDPWWNVAVQEQATDRAHRIGQKQVVTVYKLIAKDTIEERIMALQLRKKELADQILGGEGIASASFSREDLMELLS